MFFPFTCLALTKEQKPKQRYWPQALPPQGTVLFGGLCRNRRRFMLKRQKSRPCLIPELAVLQRPEKDHEADGKANDHISDEIRVIHLTSIAVKQNEETFLTAQVFRFKSEG
jgi:hypothetical protein